MSEVGRIDSRVTIDEVASRAGVSIATVSRVMNGRYGVAPATASRVRSVIDELGYESNLVARSMRSQETRIIAVLVCGIEPFSAELLKGAATELEHSGYALMVFSGGRTGEAGWEQRYLSQVSGTFADGTILVAPTVLEVEATHPVVAVDPHVGGSNLPTVVAENFDGACAAVEHLVALGHRRIGFLAGRADLESARRREAGYLEALDRAGIAFDPELVAVGDFQEEAAAAAARTLLSLPDRPTAIFAANDLSAIQVVRVAGELGLHVPDDVSVVGFDNIPESALVEPPITTVDQSIQELGREAVRLLLQLLRDGTPAETPHRTLPTHLVVRRSSGAPRHR
ncbi:MAG: LacI family DNA-binding transcriptional regulator [Ilumatobacteraceae bacterium]